MGQPMLHYILANKSVLLLLLSPTQDLLLVQEVGSVTDTTHHCIEQKTRSQHLKKKKSTHLIWTHCVPFRELNVHPELLHVRHRWAGAPQTGAQGAFGEWRPASTSHWPSPGQRRERWVWPRFHTKSKKLSIKHLPGCFLVKRAHGSLRSGFTPALLHLFCFSFFTLHTSDSSLSDASLQSCPGFCSRQGWGGRRCLTQHDRFIYATFCSPYMDTSNNVKYISLNTIRSILFQYNRLVKSFTLFRFHANHIYRYTHTHI